MTPEPTSQKPRTIADFCDGRDNNFNLIRFIAATMVIFSHCWALRFGSTPDREPYPIADYTFFSHPLRYTLGFMGVHIFFVVSGFLITQSFCRTPALWRFIGSRLFRIMPGLIAANLFCVFILGAIFTKLSLGQYFDDARTWSYLVANTLMHKGVFELPGVFANHVYPNAVNGCLWSLPHEVLCYGLVMVFGYLGMYRSALTGAVFLGTATLLVSLTGGRWAGPFNSFFEGTSITPHLMRYLWLSFAVGQTLYIARRWIWMSWWTLLIACVLTVGSAYFRFLSFLYPIFFGYAVLAVAFVPSGPLRTFRQAPDISYGLYLYGFPVTQIVLAILPALWIAPLFTLVFAMTAVLAYVSFRFVEHPSQLFFKRFGSAVTPRKSFVRESTASTV